MKTAFAIAAHPDDIEFMMGGTLLMLKDAGYEIHYMNIGSGNCGSTVHSYDQIKSIRLVEAQNAAAILGARFHPPFRDDMEIMYDLETLQHVSAIIREVKPTIVLTHSPADYMEDHTNTCRLAVSATFARGMRNFTTQPPRQAEDYDCAVYHALPHSLTDNLRRTIIPGSFVNTTRVFERKMEALKAHQSQHHWLGVSQKLNSYLQTMDDLSLKVGAMSRKFKHAEGWRRHLHYGFTEPGADPLGELGEDYAINEEYEQNLTLGF
ncbi:MAG TPA: PIG-L family deacetylase [Chryseosolibacter sp.]|nr:PIG-L family deacetylase [Chryseosolibacter sp.]